MIDFFHTQWITCASLALPAFGIADDGELAYVISDPNEKHWDAKVSNPEGKVVQFIPIDHNMIIIEGGNERSMCDGMLYTFTQDYVSFIEIKDRGSSWMEEAIAQLASTVELFIVNHGDLARGNRYAFACNPRHPRFAFSKKQRMQQFYNKYGFRLLVQQEISVK